MLRGVMKDMNLPKSEQNLARQQLAVDGGHRAATSLEVNAIECNKNSP
jgi:hypothetical protein